MSRFDTPRTEELYESSLDGGADEECGSVTENGEWFGLMREEKTILREDSQGFVTSTEYDTPEIAQAEFDKLANVIDTEEEENEDADDDEPTEDDYVISDYRGRAHVTQFGKLLGEFEDREAADAFIREHAEREQFWPNVWWQSDHGNNHRVEDWKW